MNAPEPGYAVALAHAARGRRVFPWRPITKPGKTKPDKTPLPEHGHLDATTDEATIIGWWKRWPNALAGWALPDGIGLVDVDDPAAFEAAGLELPPAPEQRGTLTRPNGLHRLYTVPDGRQTQGTIPGVDTRVGGAGWVALYSPDAFAGDPPPAPAWFPRGTRNGAAGSTNGAFLTVAGPYAAREAIATGSLFIPAGKRDGTLASIAGTLIKAGGGAESTALALELLNAAGAIEQPPGDELRDFDRIAQSVARTVARKAGAEASDTEPPGEDQARPDFRSAATIAAPIDVDRWNIEGVNRPASLLVIGGAESTGKSQAFRELAIRAATGTGSLFGHYPIARPLRVMVLDEENGEAEEYRREAAILATLGLDRATLADYFRASFAGMVLTDPASQRWLDRQVEAIRPDLLALDTGTSMIGDEWGSELKAAVRYIRSLIVRYGCSVAVLVHMVKPPRDRRPNDPAHGSAMSHVMGQWTRSADSVALVADLGADRLRWEMRKKVPPSTLILVKRDGVFDVVSIGETRKPSNDDRVLRAIAAGGVAPDDIAVSLGLAKRTVSAGIARLRRDGLIGDGYPYDLTESGREAVG